MWESAVDGQRLRFRLVGINNQNFVMQDEQTGSWWQQVTGRAIAGPLKGRQLTLVPHDEVAFGTWTADHPDGRVLKPDAAVETRDDYASLDWERRMARMRVVTELPKGSPFTARTLVVGITVDGRSTAYALDALRESRVILDVLGDVPVMLVVGEDGRSVRVFDRRLPHDGDAAATGVAPTFRPAVTGVTPTFRSGVTGALPAGAATDVAASSTPTALEFVAAPSERVMLTDLETMSEWDFAGRATSGPLAGRTLTRLPFLLEYWFDWQTYHPDTHVYKPWRPVQQKQDRLEIPRP